MKRLFCLAIIVMTVFPSGAYAQRTAEGEMGLYATYTHPFMKGWGVSGGWNRYTLFGTWDASVTVTNRGYTFERTTSVPVFHYTARAGYLVRLCATRDRSLNLYAGGGILLGAGEFRLLDKLEGIAKEYGTTFETNNFGGNPYFIFGLYPKIEAEYFFVGNVGLSVSFQMPVTFHDKEHGSVQRLTGVLYPEVSGGIKINF